MKTNTKSKRGADHNRGPSKFPHWHASQEHAKRCTMPRSRFLAMTPGEFAAWCFLGHSKDEVKTFFYAIGWVEGVNYCCSSLPFAANAYQGLKKHLSNWPTCLVDTGETFEPWDQP